MPFGRLTRWKVIERFGGCFPIAPVYVIYCTNPWVTMKQRQYNPGKTASDIDKMRTEIKKKAGEAFSSFFAKIE